MSILEDLHWRYATKKFNTKKILPQKRVNLLMEAIRLAPSSFGLQPFKVLVIFNDALKRRMKKACHDQDQVVDAPYLFVFAANTRIDNAYIDAFLHHTAAIRGVPRDSLSTYEAKIKKAIAKKTPGQRIEWAARQVYIALGVFLAAAAAERIDVTPIEGFEPEEVDRILKLEKKGLQSVVLAAVGFRSKNDETMKRAKVRLSREDLFIRE